MPDYMADPDIRAIMQDGRFAIPGDLDEAETDRLHRFLKCDQVLETFYRRNPPTARPPEEDLDAAAETAMAVYDQRSERLAVGWQKFAVLQAGIAGSPDNLDSSRVQDWAYTRIQEENPSWLGDFDDDIDRDMPLRWLTQLIGFGVLNRRRLMEEPAAPPKKKRWFGG
ncbi:MAG: hypothetical protein QOF13_2193 [Solirubrobacterales bacterium]|jgi:hypothetical protein|nr:hypothetical protein [Solirubrobacterales bacterium]